MHFQVSYLYCPLDDCLGKYSSNLDHSRQPALDCSQDEIKRLFSCFSLPLPDSKVHRDIHYASETPSAPGQKRQRGHRSNSAPTETQLLALETRPKMTATPFSSSGAPGLENDGSNSAPPLGSRPDRPDAPSLFVHSDRYEVVIAIRLVIRVPSPRIDHMI